MCIWTCATQDHFPLSSRTMPWHYHHPKLYTIRGRRRRISVNTYWNGKCSAVHNLVGGRGDYSDWAFNLSYSWLCPSKTWSQVVFTESLETKNWETECISGKLSSTHPGEYMNRLLLALQMGNTYYVPKFLYFSWILATLQKGLMILCPRYVPAPISVKWPFPGLLKGMPSISENSEISVTGKGLSGETLLG